MSTEPLLHQRRRSPTPDELRQVFGPVDSVVLEGDGGGELIEYRRQAGALQRSVVELPVPARV
jgi:hypothetical protein